MVEQGFDIGRRRAISFQSRDKVVKVIDYCGNPVSRSLLTQAHCANPGE